MFNKLKEKAFILRDKIIILYKSYRHKETPWYAKILAILVVSYAFSPIDLIPDFIPILGYLDDLILLPLGIYLSLKLIPKHIIEACKQMDITYDRHLGSYLIAVGIIGLWGFLTIELIIVFF